jgi:hypothetical protein
MILPSQGRWRAQRDGGVSSSATLSSILQPGYPSVSPSGRHLPLRGRIDAAIEGAFGVA